MFKLIALLLVLIPTTGSADNWPRFRGAEGVGVSHETGVPTTWSDTQNVRWKINLPGPGMSSPIVWGDRVFLTQSLDLAGTQRALMCFSRKDGKPLWQRVTEYTQPESTYDGEKHFCSATPATDGERIVASFGSAGLICCDMGGKLLWKKDLGRCEQLWGTAASPIIWKDLVIHNFGPGERTFLIALNKKTGDEVWRVPIPGAFGKTQPDWIGSWSTPLIAHVGNRDELIMSWPNAVKSYNPRSGKELWTCDGMGKLSYTSPLIAGDTVVAMSGFGGPYLAVRAGGSGDVTATNRLWRVDHAPQRIGSGVIVGEHIYQVNENGVAVCIELKTGKTLWEERATSTTWGSVVMADGRLYVTSKSGETVVLAAKPQFEVLARNSLNERTNASIAICSGDLFIRTNDHLWCIGRN